jgi:hypothetical protein
MSVAAKFTLTLTALLDYIHLLFFLLYEKLGMIGIPRQGGHQGPEHRVVVNQMATDHHRPSGGCVNSNQCIRVSFN